MICQNDAAVYAITNSISFAIHCAIQFVFNGSIKCAVMYRTLLVPIQAKISASTSMLCKLQQCGPLPHASFLSYSSSAAQNKTPAKITQLESKVSYASRISRWIRPAKSLFAILSTFSVSVAVGMILAAKIASYIEYICVSPLYSPSCWYFWQDSIREHFDE